jgi:adenylylsulfate kinase-like enzyme/CBS domain-containing protein
MSWAIWITGPPASGKSTLARRVAERLATDGSPVTVLDLEELLRVLTPPTTHLVVERDIVYRALVVMAAELTAVGRPVVIDATGHRREWRDLARASLPRFAEVQLECPPEVCEARGGISLPYERALAPELTIDTARVPPEDAAEAIVGLARRLGAGTTMRPDMGQGAVIWLTGLPGSGKTTLASRLAEALYVDGVPVTILEWVAVRAMVLGAACPSEAELEMAHRALAVTACLLAETGRVVVVDALAPRRAWRHLARVLAERFAEVQLVCAPETCAARERAVRWRPRPCHGIAGPTAIEWPSEYEYALNPELIIDTAARSEWIATEDLRVLARRLLRGPARSKEAAMRVRDLMSTKPITVDPGTPMLEARQRMVEERIRHLIVVDGPRIAGIVTDRDIRLNLPSPATSLSVWEVNYLLARLTVGDVMTRSVLVVAPDRPAAEAARIMMEHKISALPVTDGERLLGIVTETDFVRAIARLEGTA